VGDALLLAEGLEFAVAIGYANRADMIALGKEQFENGFAMFLEPIGCGRDLHAFFDGGHASGLELVAALDLNDAQAACAYIAEAVEMTEGGNIDVVFPRNF
jgi:hypothetical protein